MEFNITSIIVFVFALFPGVLANEIYKFVVGHNWRDDKWVETIRIISFSIFGLVLFIALQNNFGFLPYPIYLFPKTFEPNELTSSNIQKLAFSLMLHLISSSIISFLFSLIICKVVNKYLRVSTYPKAWDDFCREYVKKRWVIVGLKDGSSYAGIIEQIDTHVCDIERDLILNEPSKYDKKQKNYRALNYQYFFIPGRNINSIAAVCHEGDLSNRILKVGDNLFEN